MDERITYIIFVYLTSGYVVSHTKVREGGLFSFLKETFIKRLEFLTQNGRESSTYSALNMNVEM